MTGHDPDTCEECKREKEREEALMRDDPNPNDSE